MLAFIYGVAEVDPNLIFAAFAGSLAPTMLAITQTRGTKTAVDNMRTEMHAGHQHLEGRVDQLYGLVATNPVKVTSGHSGTTVQVGASDPVAQSTETL